MPKISEAIGWQELVRALDANMIAFRSAYGRAHGCTVHAAADVVWFYTGVPAPAFNGVLFAQLKSHAITATVDRLQAKIDEQGAPALWWVGPQSRPAELGSLLEQHGLQPAGEVPGMAIALAGLARQPELPPDLTIQRVNTTELQAVWAQVAAAGLGFADSAAAAMVRLESALSDLQDQAQQRYLGLLNGTPVATSAVAFAAGVAGIYVVATLPTARGRGIGRAMTVMPLLAARQLGYRVGVLQASHMGYSLYQKIGFHDICRYRLYLPSA